MAASERGRASAPEAGFTLVELMVVIVIIGLLSSIVAVNVLAQRARANVAKAKVDLKRLEQGIALYKLQENRLPATLDELVTGAGTDGQGPTIDGGRAALRDPWGHEYVYAPDGGGSGSRPYSLASYGGDGVAGGTHENADIFLADDGGGS